MRWRADATVASKWVLLAVLVLVAVTACTSSSQSPEPSDHEQSSQRQSGATTAASCATTATPGAASVPQEVRRIGGDWHGADGLWVNAPSTIKSVRDTDGAAYGIKYWTVTLNERGQMTDQFGPPKFTATRSGGSKTVPGNSTNYSSAADSKNKIFHFWPTTFDLPSRGCWMITESLQQTTIHYRVLVR